MPAGVPAKEQMRADVDKILRRAQHGKPIKRDKGCIIQVRTQNPKERAGARALTAHPVIPPPSSP
jgi:hypothetical protein